MIINKRVFTCGQIGSAKHISNLMKQNKCFWQYFVYKTDSKDSFLNIGNFHMLKNERHKPVILGIASSREAAKKIAVHIVKSAYADGGSVEDYIKKLIE